MVETSLTLLDDMRSNDDRAWKRFSDLYAPFIERFVVWLGAADPEDLTQNVLLKVYQALPTFDHRHGGSFRAWLRRITRNQVLAFLKASRRTPSVSQQALLDSLEDERSDPSQRWNEDHDRHVLGVAVEQARGEYGNTVFRAFFETAILGSNPAQVAADLGVSVASVYTARHRVQSRLQELVREIVD